MSLIRTIDQGSRGSVLPPAEAVRLHIVTPP
ncbi:hypothetical protein V1280_001984 [Bradyrhizobium sp. AZCC 2230]